MDNEKKIEIPFGAFDSELIHQEINIPNGFKAVIDGNKIILTKIESEDEKVRKALAEMVHDTTGDELWVDYNVHKEEALAWLEKQGEQKPTIEMKSAEESLDIDSDTYNKIVDECIYGEQKSQRMISAEAKEAMYDKPAWSEEDEEHINSLLQRLEGLCRKEFATTRFAIIEDEDWLKSLKTRYTWKPSDEQMSALENFIGTIPPYERMFQILKLLYNDLKKLIKGD